MPFARMIPSRCGFVHAAMVLMVAATMSETPRAALAGDTQKQTYQMPPKAIAKLIDAPPTPSVSVGPRHKWMLLMQRANLPPISEVSQPELRIAGIRVNPRTNGRSRVSHYESLTLKRIPDGPERTITGIPNGARIGSVSWSPDAKKIAFINTRPNGVELWIADVATGKAKKLTQPRLMTASGGSYDWVSDSSTLLCRFVPEGRGQAPSEPQVPSGPTMQENLGRKAPARTYQDLLKNTHDEALFEHYLTSRVVRVSLDGKVTPITPPGIVTRAEPSPDGKYVLLETIHRPYSYLVPMRRFPKRVEVATMNGTVVRVVADLPLADDVPVAFGSVRKGPRSAEWRADTPATLVWAEAQDGGDAGAEAEIRDRVFAMASPFKTDPVEMVALGLRYGGLMWGNQNLAMVSEWWWKTRKVRTWKMDPSKPGSQPMLLIDRSFEDRYNDPGRPVLRDTPNGTSVLLTANNGNTVFMRGPGASPEGDRPFLDRFDLQTKETKRLWRSEAPHYEYAIDILDPEKMTVLTRRESISTPPNYYVRTIGSDDLKPITKFPHPTPELANVYKEQIRYERADGVKLTATIYLPPGKKPQDGPWPMLVWAYPQEFKSADAAGQVTDSPYRFVRTSAHSPLLWLVHGYAVLNDPSLPIVGEGDEEPNDTYVEQLVSGAQAAVDEAVRRGIADRDRIAIGGHSYGAFMTANLLARSDLFRAGIARSGAYNRTLTPFGFQSEERTYWEAPDVYYTMSPFMHAEKVNEPILLIHGEADNNSGTFPIQSKRYYHALKGHGATARLVMLPHESHGYRARESIMHMAWEMTEWMDKYVKNAKPKEN